MQVKEFKKIRLLLKNNEKHFPSDVVKVVQATSKKFYDLNQLNTQVQLSGKGEFYQPEQRLDAIEEKYSQKLSPDYKPMTFAELEAIHKSIKVPMSVDLENPNEKVEVSKPVESDPTLKIDPLAKKN